MIYSGKSHVILSLLCAISFYLFGMTSAHAVFINEIHYDNGGEDSGEGIELSGEAGIDLSGWSLVLYNGSASSLSPYAPPVGLTGTFTNMQNGMGVLGFGIAGIQNGGPDGIALVDDLGSVVQFLSYEGSFTARSGVAEGVTSSDIGVAETSSTAPGYSLQLMGTGREYADFSWESFPIVQTFGDINHNQSFAAPVSKANMRSAISVPEPPSLLLFLLGLLVFLGVKGMASERLSTVLAG